jgi:hypothetical protein
MMFEGGIVQGCSYHLLKKYLLQNLRSVSDKH